MKKTAVHRRLVRPISRWLGQTSPLALRLLLAVTLLLSPLAALFGAPALPAEAGTLTTTSVTPFSLVAGVTTNVGVAFTTVSQVPVNGKIKVTFPANFLLDATGAGSTQVVTSSGFASGTTFTTSVSGQVLTITTAVGSPAIAATTAATLVVSNIRNPQVSGSAGAYTLATFQSDGTTQIDTAAPAATTIAAGSLLNATVVPASLATSASGSATVTFTTANPVANDGRIKVTFGAGFNLSAVATATSSSIDGTLFIRSVAAQVVTVQRTGGTTMAAGQTYSLVLSTITNSASTGTTGAYSLATTNSSDVNIDTAAPAASTLVAATLTATSVTPASLLPGSTGNATVALTTASPVSANGAIKVTFPAAFTVSSGATTAVTTATGFTAGTVTISGQSVTVVTTTAISAATAVSFVLSNIKTPTSTGSGGTYTIQTLQTDGTTVVDQNAAVTASTIATGALASTSVTPVSLVAGASGNVTVVGTTVNAVPAGGTVKVTFPASSVGSFTLSNGAATAVLASTGFSSGTQSAGVAGSIATVTTTGGIAAATPFSFVLSNVRVPQVTGSTGTYTLQTTQADGTTLIDTASPAASTITVGALTSTSVTPASLVASATGNVTVSFTTANPLPSTARIKVTFPAGFSFASMSSTATSGSLDGGFTAVANAQVVSIFRDGAGTSATAGAYSVTLANVTNPSATGATGTFTILTATFSDVSIDTATPAAVTIVSSVGALAATSVTPSSLVPGNVGTATVALTTASAIPANGFIKVTFPAAFAVSSGATTAVTGASGFTAGTATISGQVVTIPVSALVSGATALSFGLTNIKNPTTAGSGGTYSIQTFQTDGTTTIDQNVAVTASTIASGALTSATVTPVTLVAGGSGNVSVVFTTANAVASGGVVKLTFPSNFGSFALSNGSATTVSAAGMTAGTVTVSGSTLTVVATGGIPAATVVTLVLTNVRNPQVSGVTGAYTLQTLQSDGVSIIDTVAPAQSTITAGALTSATVTPASLLASVTGNVTVAFTTANPLPATGTIKVTFPAGGVAATPAGFTLTNPSITASSGTIDGSLLVTVSGQVATITRSGGSALAPGGYSLTLTNITTNSSAGATAAYTLVTTTAAGTTIDSGAPAANTILAAIGTLAATSVTPATLAPGNTGTATVALTTVSAIPSNGFIKVTFPAGFTLSSGSTTAVGTAAGFTAGTVTIVGQSVTVTVTGGASAAAALSLTLTNLKNPTATGSAGVYSIQTLHTDGTTVIDQNAAVTASTIATGALAAPTVTPISLVAGSSGVVTVVLTTINAIPAGGALKVTFPVSANGSFGLSNGAATAVLASTGFNSGTQTAAVAGNVVTVTSSGGAAAAQPLSFILSNIRVPQVSGASGAFTLQTTQADGTTVIDTGAPASVTITVGALTATSVTPASLVSAATGNVTVSFTAANPVPASGRIKVTFPAGFSFASLGATATSGSVDGGFTVVAVGQVVTVFRDGTGTALPAGSYSLTLTGVTNPAATGATAAYTLQTATFNDVSIDTGAPAATTIVATVGALAATSVTPANLLPGNTGTATVALTTVNAIPANGFIKVTFPATFTLSSGATTAVSTATGFTAGTATISGQVVTIPVSASVAGATALTVGLTNIKNPAATGSAGTYSIQTFQTDGSTAIDQNAAVTASTIASGALSASSVTPVSLVAGSSGTATVAFTTANAIPAGGGVKITFPASFALSDGGTTSVLASTGFSSTAQTAAVSGQVVTVTSTAGAPAATPLSLILSNIRVPQVAGGTGTYTVQTVQADGSSVIDTVNAAQSTITAGALTATSVTLASLVASASGSVAVAFTNANPIPATARIKVTFPAGFTFGTLTATSGTVDGGLTAVAVGQVVTVFRSGSGTTAVAAAQTVTIGGVVNPSTAGATGTYTIATSTFADVAIDTATAAASTITATTPALTGVAVVPANLAAGATGNVAVAFTTTSAITSNGKVRVTFPTGFTLNAAGAGSTTVVGSAGFTTGTTFSTSVSGQVVTVSTTIAGTAASAGANITLLLSNVTTPAVSGATGTYTLETLTSASAGIDGPTTAAASTITAGALTNASVTPASLSAGATTSVTVAFTTANALPADSHVRVTFPAGFVLTSPSLTSTSGSITGSLLTTVAGQVVTVHRIDTSALAAGAYTLSVSNVVNPTTTGATGTYTIQTLNSALVVIDANAAVAASTIGTTAGAITGASVTPASLATSATGNVSIALTTTGAIPTGGFVAVTFPAGFTLNAGGVTTASGASGFTAGTTTVSSLTVKVTATGGASAGATLGFTLSNVQNPAASGSGGAYTLQTLQANGTTVIDENAAVTASTFTTTSTGVLTGVAVTPASLAAGATGNVTVAFTAANTVGSNGQVKVTFPTGFLLDAGGSGTTQVAGAIGFASGATTTTAVAGQTATVTVTTGANAITAGTAVTLVLSSVRNPRVSGATGTFSVETTTSGSVTVDGPTSAAGVTISSGPLSPASVAPASLIAGATSTVTVTFTTSNPLPANGAVKVTFPSGFGLTQAGLAAVSTSIDGGLLATVAGQTVAVLRNGAGTELAAGSYALTISNVVNPTSTGSTGAYAVQTTNASATVIDANSSVAASTIVATAGTLSGATVTPATLVPGDTGTATAAFTTATAIPAGGSIRVTFPAGFTLGTGGVSGVVSASGFNAGTVTVSGQNLTVAVVGAVPASTAISFGVTRLKNPVTAGSTGPYALQTFEADGGTLIDQNAAVPASTMANGALTGVSVTPSTLVAGSTGSLTVALTTVNPIPAGGRVTVVLPAGSGSFLTSSGGTTGVVSSSGFNAGAQTATASGSTVTVTSSGGAAAGTALTLVLGNVRMPQVSGGTGAYTVQTQQTDGTTLIDSGSGAQSTITAGTLAVLTITPANPVAGASGSVGISFTSANPIPADGRIKVTFPAGYGVSGAGSASSGTLDGSLTVSVAGQVVTVARSGGTAATGAQNLSVAGITTPTATGPTGAPIAQTTTSGSSAIDEGTAAATTVVASAGTLSPTTVTPGSLTAGATSSITVTLTTANAVPAGGAVRLTLPSGFTPNALGAGTTAVAASFGFGGGAVTAAVVGQMVTVTTAGGASAGAPLTLILSAIKNPTVSGSSGVYSLQTFQADGVTVIDQNTAVTASAITPGALSATVTPASSSAGVTGAVAVAFTTTNPLPAGGAVRVAFGSGFDLTGLSATTTAGGIDGTLTAVATGQTVTVYRSGGSSVPAGALSLTLSGVKNPTATGGSGAYTVQTLSSAAAVIDQGTAAETTIAAAAGAISGASVTPAGVTAGASGQVTLALTPAQAIPAGGQVKFTLPSGFTVNSGGATGIGGSLGFGSGAVTATAGGSVVTLTAAGGAGAGAALVAVLTNIANPTVMGATGSFVLRTYQADGVTVIDENTAVAGVTLTAGAITGAAVTPASLSTSASGAVTVTFSTNNPIPAGGGVKVSFPTGFVLSGITTVTSGTLDGALVASVSGQTVSVLRSGGTAGAAGAHSLTLTSVTNPSTAGATGSFAIQTMTAGSVTVDENTSVSPVTLANGQYTRLLVLAPGEAAAPGTLTGKTGTPVAQQAGTAFSVTVKAVDSAFNPVTSTDFVAITASDSSASLPVSAALTAGEGTFSVILNAVGIFGVTASDVTDPTRTAGSASGITVSAGVPSVPRSVTATGGALSATVTWQAPATTGGQPVLDYQVTMLPDNLITTVTGLTLTQNALTADLTYTFTVRARNAIGYGPASTAVQAIPTFPQASGGGGGGGGSSVTTPTTPAQTTPPASGGPAASVSVPASSGGNVSITDVSVAVPPAAVTPPDSGAANPVTGSGGGNVRVSVQRVDLSKLTTNTLSEAGGDTRLLAPLPALATPEGYVAGSLAFTVAVTDSDGKALTLEKPLILRAAYNNADVELAGGRTIGLHLMWYDRSTRTWVDQAGRVEGTAVVAQSQRQGLFALLVELPRPTVTPAGTGFITTNFQPQLLWTNPANTTQVHLQVIPANNDGPGVNLILDDATAFTIPAPKLGVGNYLLLPDMGYTWRVRSTRSSQPLGELDAGWSLWSSGTFRTASATSAYLTPVAPLVGGTVATLTPTLQWKDLFPQVFYYEVQVSRDPDFGPSAPLYWELRHGGTTTPLDSYRVPAAYPLEPGATYYWRVRPRVQGDGKPVPWSDTWQFATPGGSSAP